VSFVHGLELLLAQRSELLVAHEKFGQFPLMTVYIVPV
jgi:hypothetical protein